VLAIAQKIGPAGGVPSGAVCGIFSRLFLYEAFGHFARQVVINYVLRTFAGGVIVRDLSASTPSI
jgi:hypothetical protein